MSILQELQDSQIRVLVTSFFENGFSVRIGDDAQGFVDIAVVKTWGEVEAWLEQEAVKRWPDSPFAVSRLSRH